jgi:hypothetical protein
MSAHPPTPAEVDGRSTTRGATARKGNLMQLNTAPSPLVDVDARIARTPATSPGRATSDPWRPTALEVAEGSLIAATGVFIGAAVLPGFLLTVPALIFFGLPLLAIGLLAAAGGLVVLLAATPVVVGWRVARRSWHALAALRARRALSAAPRRGMGSNSSTVEPMPL